jgi:hypothetical protein
MAYTAQAYKSWVYSCLVVNFLKGEWHETR